MAPVFQREASPLVGDDDEPGGLKTSQDCSSGACERNWSAHALVHTKRRNRLSTSQIERLIYCRENMRIMHKFENLTGPMQGWSAKKQAEGHHDVIAEKSSGKRLEAGKRYRLGDMVWAKVKSHPWWPGQIFDSARASSLARKSRREGHVLVAFFGDSTFGWFQEEELIPFEVNFLHKSRQTTMPSFCAAVEDALEEITRRISIGLTCPCQSKVSKAKSIQNSSCVPRYQTAVEHLGRHISEDRSAYNARKILTFMKNLARSPFSFTRDMLWTTKAAAQVCALRAATFALRSQQYEETFNKCFEADELQEYSEEREDFFVFGRDDCLEKPPDKELHMGKVSLCKRKSLVDSGTEDSGDADSRSLLSASDLERKKSWSSGHGSLKTCKETMGLQQRKKLKNDNKAGGPREASSKRDKERLDSSIARNRNLSDSPKQVVMNGDAKALEIVPTHQGDESDTALAYEKEDAGISTDRNVLGKPKGSFKRLIKVKTGSETDLKQLSNTSRDPRVGKTREKSSKIGKVEAASVEKAKTKNLASNDSHPGREADGLVFSKGYVEGLITKEKPQSSEHPGAEGSEKHASGMDATSFQGRTGSKLDTASVEQVAIVGEEVSLSNDALVDREELEADKTIENTLPGRKKKKRRVSDKTPVLEITEEQSCAGQVLEQEKVTEVAHLDSASGEIEKSEIDGNVPHIEPLKKRVKKKRHRAMEPLEQPIEAVNREHGSIEQPTESIAVATEKAASEKIICSSDNVSVARVKPLAGELLVGASVGHSQKNIKKQKVLKTQKVLAPEVAEELVETTYLEPSFEGKMLGVAAVAAMEKAADKEMTVLGDVMGEEVLVKSPKLHGTADDIASELLVSVSSSGRLHKNIKKHRGAKTPKVSEKIPISETVEESVEVVNGESSFERKALRVVPMEKAADKEVAVRGEVVADEVIIKSSKSPKLQGTVGNIVSETVEVASVRGSRKKAKMQRVAKVSEEEESIHAPDGQLISEGKVLEKVADKEVAILGDISVEVVPAKSESTKLLGIVDNSESKLLVGVGVARPGKNIKKKRIVKALEVSKQVLLTETKEELIQTAHGETSSEGKVLEIVAADKKVTEEVLPKLLGIVDNSESELLVGASVAHPCKSVKKKKIVKAPEVSKQVLVPETEELIQAAHREPSSLGKVLANVAADKKATEEAPPKSLKLHQKLEDIASDELISKITNWATGDKEGEDLTKEGGKGVSNEGSLLKKKRKHPLDSKALGVADARAKVTSDGTQAEANESGGIVVGPPKRRKKKQRNDGSSAFDRAEKMRATEKAGLSLSDEMQVVAESSVVPVSKFPSNSSEKSPPCMLTSNAKQMEESSGGASSLLHLAEVEKAPRHDDEDDVKSVHNVGANIKNQGKRISGEKDEDYQMCKGDDGRLEALVEDTDATVVEDASLKDDNAINSLVEDEHPSVGEPDSKSIKLASEVCQSSGIIQASLTQSELVNSPDGGDEERQAKLKNDLEDTLDGSEKKSRPSVETLKKPSLSSVSLRPVVDNVTPLRSNKDQTRQLLKKSSNIKTTPDKDVTGKQSEQKTASEDEQVALIMKFPQGFALPLEAQLRATFVRFGPLDPSGIRVYRSYDSAQVVFQREADANMAFKSVSEKRAFGQASVIPRLKKLRKVVKVEDIEKQPQSIEKQDMDKTASASELSPPLKSCLKRVDDPVANMNVKNTTPRVRFQLSRSTEAMQSTSSPELMVEASPVNTTTNITLSTTTSSTTTTTTHQEGSKVAGISDKRGCNQMAGSLGGGLDSPNPNSFGSAIQDNDIGDQMLYLLHKLNALVRSSGFVF